MKNHKKITMDDLFYLSTLLKNGVNITSCLTILKNKNNEPIFNEILNSLNEGYKIEEIISKYMYDDIDIYFEGLISKTSFNNALSLSLRFKEEIKEESSIIINTCLYPFILLFASISALYLFDIYGLDNIFNLLIDFKSDIKGFVVIRLIVRIFIKVFYYGLLFVICLIFIMTRNKRIILFYEFINKFTGDNLIKSFYTCQFISLLRILYEEGYSTKKSLEILRGLIRKPIISLMAYRLDEELNNGEEIINALNDKHFDKLLSGFLKTINYIDDFDEALSKYIVIVKLQTKKKMKRLSVILEAIIYLFIGFIIIFVYQILFMPLKAIGGI